MPTCPDCKTERPGNFCPECGTRLLKEKGGGKGSNSPTPRQSVQASDLAGLVGQYQGTNIRKRIAMVSSSSVGMNRISVAVRKRPLNSNETGLDIISVDSLNTMKVLEPKKSVDGTRFIEPHDFFFDEVFDDSDGNEEVYKRTAKRLISLVYDGGYCSCFAYGQTGSGKTYTMMGTNSAEKGLYLQASDEIFSRLEPNLCVEISFFEIYASKLYDLLNNREPIHAREDENKQVHIRGLTEHRIESSADMMVYVKKGLENRSQSTTTMNDESSRSHAILDIKLKLSSGKQIGKLSVVDLAGSERAAVGHAGDKQVQMEGAEINKSLLALKECIRALDQGAKHVPFRQSELTQVLKESFIGDNGHTMMIANISPSNDSCVETLNTLRYAYRIKALTVDDEVKKKFSGAGLDFSKTTSSSNQIKNAQGDLIRTSKEKPKCPGCSTEKRNLAALEAHKETCPLMTVQCQHCPTSFKRKDQEKHNKTCVKYPVECRLCKEAISRDALKRHQTVDCPKGETSCLFCRKKLLREALEQHKNTCEQRVITCEDCSAKVKFSQMQGHKRTCKKGKGRDSTASSTSPPSIAPLGNNGSSIALPVKEAAAAVPIVSKVVPRPLAPIVERDDDPSPTNSPTVVTPTPPVSNGKRASQGGRGSNASGTSPTPICPFKDLGCGSSGCDSDSHVTLLLKENLALRKDLAAVNYRLEILEKTVNAGRGGK
eukprot:TRINITY_DN1939_c2_g1_i1.p1 TRINITY_DN1939_c2_g1~~TRINITY_DN1939_c2_g1_i1.p1  ORF type:complete len:714 (+),score=90.26 TRINITY_DN1939_c2_g1_i1:55-2196(+)